MYHLQNLKIIEIIEIHSTTWHYLNLRRPNKRQTMRREMNNWPLVQRCLPHSLLQCLIEASREFQNHVLMYISQALAFRSLAKQWLWSQDLTETFEEAKITNYLMHRVPLERFPLDADKLIIWIWQMNLFSCCNILFPSCRALQRTLLSAWGFSALHAYRMIEF